MRNAMQVGFSPICSNFDMPLALSSLMRQAGSYFERTEFSDFIGFYRPFGRRPDRPGRKERTVAETGTAFASTVVVSETMDAGSQKSTDTLQKMFE
jgi:hypothetical protein